MRIRGEIKSYAVKQRKTSHAIKQRETGHANRKRKTCHAVKGRKTGVLEKAPDNDTVHTPCPRTL